MTPRLRLRRLKRRAHCRRWAGAACAARGASRAGKLRAAHHHQQGVDRAPARGLRTCSHASQPPAALLVLKHEQRAARCLRSSVRWRAGRSSTQARRPYADGAGGHARRHMPAPGLAAIPVRAVGGAEHVHALGLCGVREAACAARASRRRTNSLRTDGSAGRQFMVTHPHAHSSVCESRPPSRKRNAECMQAQEAVMSTACASGHVDSEFPLCSGQSACLGMQSKRLTCQHQMIKKYCACHGVSMTCMTSMTCSLHITQASHRLACQART